MAKKFMVVIFIIFIGFFSSGCVRPIIMKSLYPSYDETISLLPKLKNEYGRVIFYNNNFAETLIWGGASSRISIKIEDYQCSAEHGQFVYDDLPVGSYTISSEPYKYGPLQKKQEPGVLTLDIRAGKLLYVEISYKKSSLSESDALQHLYLRIVDEKTALDVLATSPQYTYAYEKIKSCLAQQLLF
ncbi:MAG: hypothetical protein K8S13_14350 [Desulfobacula sp.]|uniref:hypothetical protein n=1 Tax=Desulfobacula sp. TaxID=2593537 RepID=UPI0025BB30E6|nr:hypothetical protein [Desulfobacula sp.]MCD4721017.1 hypothetical protein [Desulfobacula sp.]